MCFCQLLKNCEVEKSGPARKRGVQTLSYHKWAILSNGRHVEERAKPLGTSTGLTITLRHTLVHPHTETREAPMTRHSEHGFFYFFACCFDTVKWWLLLTVLDVRYQVWGIQLGVKGGVLTLLDDCFNELLEVSWYPFAFDPQQLAGMGVSLVYGKFLLITCLWGTIQVLGATAREIYKYRTCVWWRDKIGGIVVFLLLFCFNCLIGSGLEDKNLGMLKSMKKNCHWVYHETKTLEPSTTWTVQCGGDRLPLWLAACGIHVLVESGWSANSAHSSTAGM